MLEGVSPLRRFVLAGMLFYTAVVGSQKIYQDYQKNAADIAHREEKKEAKQKLTQKYAPDMPTSEAVFILPPPYETDGYWKVRPYLIRDELIKNGIPAFIIGDTSGKATQESIERNVKDIQAAHHFKAVTTLSFTHGGVYDTKNGQLCTDSTEIKASDAWAKHENRIEHVTTINRDLSKRSPYTRELISGVRIAANVKKMDWVSFECYSGAMNQHDIDGLYNGVYIGMCGGGQVNYMDAQKLMLESLKRHEVQFDEGIDATDWLVETLKENWREYGADIVIGVANGGGMSTIVNDNRENTKGDKFYQANAQQLERAQKTKFRKKPGLH